jgi:hypothetical protein
MDLKPWPELGGVLHSKRVRLTTDLSVTKSTFATECSGRYCNDDCLALVS